MHQEVVIKTTSKGILAHMLKKEKPFLLFFTKKFFFMRNCEDFVQTSFNRNSTARNGEAILLQEALQICPKQWRIRRRVRITRAEMEENMKAWKKLGILAAAFILTVSLTACGKNDDTNENEPSGTPSVTNAPTTDPGMNGGSTDGNTDANGNGANSDLNNGNAGSGVNDGTNQNGSIGQDIVNGAGNVVDDIGNMGSDIMDGVGDMMTPDNGNGANGNGTGMNGTNPTGAGGTGMGTTGANGAGGR